ncbi:hypothetical protein COHA_000407 [Chlorella ohadii]|uniref:Uncharacterized protein n=1 Tax=Chlorella ohadii TaxID=2649997 RepID=A0AAD5DXX2_9CHLO|nr:hypothetical protein COHA_000407 [Chlorella ohadii]
MRGLRALLLALACLGLMLVAVRAQAADPAAAMLANATAPAPAAADSHADHDHDHDHAHEAPAATQSPAAENGTAVTAAAAAADDHAHEEEGHDHAAEATAAGTDAHDHAGEEGGSHAGHSHGISVTDYCAALAEGIDPCAYTELENYNLGLHIGSVFILLGVSLAGALLPVLLHISSKSSLVLTCVKMGTYFGFGTILSTAFIHMLLPAAQNLSSPCLSEGWNEAYEAWAYMFVTVAIVFMQLIDYLIEGAYQRYLEKRGSQPHTAACHEQAHGMDEHNHHAAVVGAIASMHTSKAHLGGVAKHPAEAGKDPAETCHDPTHDHGHGHHDHSHSHKHGHKHSHDEEAGLPDGTEEGGSEDAGPCQVHGEGCSTLIHHKPDVSRVFGIYLMEAGIIFHSVLIGLTLGVTGGDSFKTLLVALAFHQFFEGFAIGSAVVDSGLGLWKSVMAGAIYSITTPLGIAVGIAVRESFNQNAQTTLLVEGIFDAISTGILIYVVLVELITPLMTQSAWLRSRRWPIQVAAFASFYAGVAVMAAIGKWV